MSWVFEITISFVFLWVNAEILTLPLLFIADTLPHVVIGSSLNSIVRDVLSFAAVRVHGKMKPKWMLAF